MAVLHSEEEIARRLAEAQQEAAREEDLAAAQEEGHGKTREDDGDDQEDEVVAQYCREDARQGDFGRQYTAGDHQDTDQFCAPWLRPSALPIGHVGNVR